MIYDILTIFVGLPIFVNFISGDRIYYLFKYLLWHIFNYCLLYENNQEQSHFTETEIY